MTTFPKSSFFDTRRGRVIREHVTAYLFLSPAMLLIFIFGIFPVGFAFFVSLHQWRRFPGEYIGLDQYVRGLDGAAYVLFFWIGLGALVYSAALLRQLFRQPDWGRALGYMISGIASGGAILLLVNWTAVLLPIILNIPQRIRGQERVQGLFLSELAASFQVAEAYTIGNQFLLLLVAAAVITAISFRVIKGIKAGSYWFWSTAAVVAAAVGLLTLQLTASEINTAVEAARANGTDLPLWSQIVMISAGVGLVGVAYLVWRRGVRSYGDRRFIAAGLAAILLACGGVILAMELPRALAESDPDVLSGFSVTVMFVFGTVPLQLAIGLGLAVLMFQNIKGKSLFRVIYFIPYIMPFVATSVVFNLLFSHRSTSLANQVIGLFGIPAQKWLLEPKGINSLIAGQDLGGLEGPSLALIVVMIYTVWTYIGYDAVVFLAGLGNISGELYEAARIDGASGWAIFRHITLPLLSPTTFFLSLIAIIGTFQAFTQIWIMRTPAAGNSVDTIGIYIYETVRNTDPNMGYASALSIVLFAAILIFTLVQNRLQGRNVFYG